MILSVLTIKEENSCSYEDIIIGNPDQECGVIKTPAITIYTKTTLELNQQIEIESNLTLTNPEEGQFNYSFLSYDSIYSTVYSVNYWVDNAFLILLIAFVIVALIFLFVNSWSGLAAGGFSLFVQVVLSFALMFIFYLPFSEAVAFGLIFLFVIASFIKLLYLNKYKGHLKLKKLNDKSFDYKKEIIDSLKWTQSETKYITIFTYSILLIASIIYTALVGVPGISFLIFMSVAFVLWISFWYVFNAFLVKTCWNA